MGHAGYIACALLLLCPLALSRHDDDFAFDSDEFQLDLNVNHSEIAKNGLRRLWGVPDTSAYVRHLFRMEIPKEAFSGEVSTYKVRSENGRHLPSWLAVDTKHGLISGIPQHQDIGVHHFTVTAHGRTHGLTATDSFTIEVKKSEDKPHSKYGTCSVGEERLVLCIMVDGALHQITPRQRIRALMELASFMALDGDEFWMEPYKPSSLQSVLTSGVGTTTRRRGDATTAIYFNVGCGDKLWPRHRVLVGGLREQARDGTLANTLRLPVLGWRLGAVAAPRAKRQTQPIDDGSGTYDTYDGEDDQDDYSGYGDADEEEDYGTGDAGGLDGTNVYPAVEPPSPPAPPAPSPSPHPHRHHHGEPSPDVPDLPDYTQQPPHTTTDVFQTETAASPTTTTSTTTTTSPPATLPPPSPPPASTAAATESPAPTITAAPDTTEPSTNTYVTEGEKVQITPYSESASEASNVNYSRIMPFESLPNVPRKLGGHSPVVIVPEDFATTPEPETQTVIIRASNELPPMSSSEAPTPSSPQPTSTEETILWTPITPVTSTSTTTPAPVVVSQTTMVLTVPTTPATTTSTVAPTTTQEAETTIEEVTKQDPSISTERTSTITGQTTETIILPMPVNQPPSLKHHMKKLAVTAGKAFKYIIPEDLFTDPEEGSNLTFTMYGADKTNLSSWIQFIPSEREVYGLPLESHVSRWPFIVEARDSEGLVARGPLDVTVQQHKSGRTISHQFLLQFKLNKTYTKAIDWQIRALEGIVNLFKGSGWRDTDVDQLTVLNATQNGDLYEFVWTNDTLPKDGACSTDAVKRLMRIMESEAEPGSPSPDLIRAMAPELKVSAVRWQGVGRCAQLIPATKSPADYPPVSRNQVDHITATVGHLLVFKVPEDTFYDPEEDNTRNLHLSLRYSDRSELPAGHWLQFDANNQEFYGLPGPGDEAAVNYQLIAEDSAKNSAYDSLIVEVVKAPAIKPTVEFQMTMEYPFPSLAYNANNKRKVVEKLAELFGQTDTENIRIQSITDNPTTIIWYNTSLPMDRCPKREIEELRKMIITDNRDNRGTVGGALRENVDHVFDKDFKVMAIRLIPQGLCAEQSTKTIKQPTEYAPGNTQGSKTSSESGYTEYLVTFVIPAVVIVCMILVAGIIACVLYKRRRTGKMSVGDEEERQAFRSKGIPVIFQDELEERGDAEPAHKSPVIMRDEKPPLLPPAPDYRGSSGEAPYRPPPPFAASRTPPRPKATPTYRKPPPYVPP